MGHGLCSNTIKEISSGSQWLRQWGFVVSGVCKCVNLCVFVGSVVQKMMEFLQNLLGPDDHEHLLVGPSRVPMETFVQHFQWDVARYPLRLQLTSLIEVINKV